MITGTRRIAAVAGGAALLLVAIWYFALWHPQSKHLAAAHQARTAAEQQASTLDSQIGQLRALVRQIPTDNAHLSALSAGIPDLPSLDTALDQLHAVAVRSGVDLTSVGPSSPSPSQGGSGSAASSLPAITLGMTASGSPAQIAAFLEDLQNPSVMPRLIVIDRITLSSGGQTSAQITGRIFFADAAAASSTSSS